MAKSRSKKGRSAIRRIKVMVSSRCNDAFPAGGDISLTKTRRQLKERIESVRLFDQQLFDVWINEDAPAPATEDSWDTCMAQVDACDILLVLFNGNAGWTVGKGDLGICHGEWQRGRHSAPGKVHLIQIGTDDDLKACDLEPDKRFRGEVAKSGDFVARALSPEALFDEASQTLLHAVTQLVSLGGQDSRGSRFHLGEALEWSKLDYRARADRIADTLGASIVQNGGEKVGGRTFTRQIEGVSVFFAVHAVPGAMSIGAAREMVGRPFLRDHEHVAAMAGAAGPVHLIGCNRTATETQAATLLGFPDAAIVAAPFGIYVADEVQKVQFVLLENCRDDALTRLALQRFIAWLDQTGEGAVLAARAEARQRIAKAIDAERASA